MALTQQLAAIYQLQEFMEYGYASVPILENLRAEFAVIGGAEPLLRAIDSTLMKLRSKQS